MAARRIDQGGRIDRGKPLSFTWDGRPMTGYQGDTLASALLANNVRVLARSFKYHRPRGITAAGVEESGGLVTIGSGARLDPNVRVTAQELHEGLVASGQNAWPSVRFDIGGLNDLMSRFFAAGFYYKTFMGLPPFEWGRGTGWWMRYEKLIRRAAGMGRASREPDPDRYEHGHEYCDVLVAGAGPAGLEAARAAAAAGLDVLLVEQDYEPGGSFLAAPEDAPRAAAVEAALSAGVRVMTRATVFGLYDHCVAGIYERVTDHVAAPAAHQPRHRMWTVRARYTILATGALERHLAFGDNDRPGVMGAAAALTYLNRYAVLPGENIVIATNNDSAYPVAAGLAGAGARVKLLEARPAVPGEVSGLATAGGAGVECGAAPLRALGARGVHGLETATTDGGGWRPGPVEQCDLVLVSGGWSPVVNLLSHRGAKPVWDADKACFVPGDTAEPIGVAGSAAGIWDHDACVASGRAAGIAAARTLGVRAAESAAPVAGGWSAPIRPVYEIRVPGRKLKSFVDIQNDVTSEDVRLAHREGFVSVEHLKRYTTLGMATDQGKVGNVIGLALMAEAQGREIPEVGTTTFRPPYTPVSIGALRGRSAGPHFKPLRRTPMHDWNLARGAVMTEAGLWQRPWYFPRDAESLSSAYEREAQTVRRSVGLCDVTSLGKIAIQGPDAATLLNRVYANAFARLAVGKARYGIMLRDDGIVMDDGTTWRLGETEFFMTTTTAHAAQTMAWLEELLQTRWPDLKVHVTSVSEQWGGVAVAGPESRDVLEQCVADAAMVSNDALPFMGVVQTELRGNIPCRIARISFSGERAYEVYFPSDYSGAVMDRLFAEVAARDGCLYGLEALGALRVEKGHVTHAELDGRMTMADAGLGRMASTKKPYIGRVLAGRPELVKDERPQLVGILPRDRGETFNAGAIIFGGGEISGRGDGWITAVTHSPELGHWIGLGYVAGGHERWQGSTLVAADPVRKGNTDIEVVSPHMVDPSGERMHG